ncbi:unnamed protein product, partial [Meganyctiphanes norvegica]
QMAMPANDVVALALVNILLHTYGDLDSDTWLGARGVEAAQHMVVTQGAQANTTISSEDPLWAPNDPDLGFTTAYCLMLGVALSSTQDAPGHHPYYSQPCSRDWEAAPLCEVPVYMLFNDSEVVANPGEQAQLDCGFI